MNHELSGTPMAIDPSALPLSEALSIQGGPVRRIDQSQNHVVVIPVVGVLMPRVPFYAEAYGLATSTERLAAQVEQVAADRSGGDCAWIRFARWLSGGHTGSCTPHRCCQ